MQSPTARLDVFGDPVPAVSAKRLSQARRKGLSVTHPKITFDMPDPPHAGNHRAHGRMFQDESQRQFRQIHPIRQQRPDSFDALERLFQLLRREIDIPPVALGPAESRVSVPVRLPSSNGTRAMIAMP